MDKNKNICYCILGSIVLSLINCNIFDYARCGLFSGGTFIGRILYFISNIVSLIGIILTVIFSVLLIIRNFDFKI